MARIPKKRITAALAAVKSATTAKDKGRALEDFVCEFFALIPGIRIAQRNALNAFATEELDVGLWNDRHPRGLDFLPNLLLVECKNWSTPCGSQEVAYFVNRLRQRGRDHGILVSANGVTGDAQDLTRAHFEIATALRDGIHVLVVSPDELAALQDTGELVTLFKTKLCQLVVSGTVFG